MTVSLLALSSAAIASVYAVGYVNSSAGESAAPSPIVAAATTAPQVRANPDVAGRVNSGATPEGGSTSGRQPAPSAAAGGVAAAYQDGTYVATGTSRHGNIEATVVVANGQIVSAQISSCQTRYPCSKIGSLPPQVVARQSVTVNRVSGSTDSSNAYLAAVASALAKAKAA